MTDFSIIKFIHALTFEMTLKAAKCHLQNMHGTLHNVSNTDNCIIVIHSSYLCTKYKFSSYKESLWNSDRVTGKNNEPAEWLKYLVNSITWRKRNKEAFCLPGIVFYFTQVLKKKRGFICIVLSALLVIFPGWDRSWFGIDCHDTQTSIYVP